MKCLYGEILCEPVREEGQNIDGLFTRRSGIQLNRAASIEFLYDQDKLPPWSRVIMAGKNKYKLKVGDIVLTPLANRGTEAKTVEMDGRPYFIIKADEIKCKRRINE